MKLHFREIESCRFCPWRTMEHNKQVCSQVWDSEQFPQGKKRLDDIGDIPEWCPLPEYETSNPRTLEALNADLVEALEKIDRINVYGADPEYVAFEVGLIAKEALRKAGKDVQDNDDVPESPEVWGYDGEGW